MTATLKSTDLDKDRCPRCGEQLGTAHESERGKVDTRHLRGLRLIESGHYHGLGEDWLKTTAATAANELDKAADIIASLSRQLAEAKAAENAKIPSEQELITLIEHHLSVWITAPLNILGVFPTAARQDARDLAAAIRARVTGKDAG